MHIVCGAVLVLVMAVSASTAPRSDEPKPASVRSVVPVRVSNAPKALTEQGSAQRRSPVVDADLARRERLSGVPTQLAPLQANQASAIAAIAMAMIGALQLGLFAWQLKLMRRTVADAAVSAKAAQSAADAASLNARAAIGIELPILTAQVFGLLSTPRPFDPFDAPGGTVNTGYPGRYSGAGPVTYKNNGRSPALLEFIELGWMAVGTLPPTPRYEVVVPLEHFAIIPAGEEFQVPYELCIELTEEQQRAIRDGTAKLWVYGSLHYRDFLGDHREARFCCNYDCIERGHLNPFGFVYHRRPPRAYTAQMLSVPG